MDSLEELSLEKYTKFGFIFHHASGLTVSQKIKIATNINFFISDAGTASMIPDRFCKKAGVVYKPAGWTAPGHVYFNSSMVPDNKVKNHNKTNAVNSDYFICHKYLSDLILKKMKSSLEVI